MLARNQDNRWEFDSLPTPNLRSASITTDRHGRICVSGCVSNESGGEELVFLRQENGHWKSSAVDEVPACRSSHLQFDSAGQPVIVTFRPDRQDQTTVHIYRLKN